MYDSIKPPGEEPVNYLSQEIANFTSDILAESELKTLVEAVRIIRTAGYNDVIRIIGSRLDNNRIGTTNWNFIMPELGFPEPESQSLYRLLNEFIVSNHLNQSEWLNVREFALSIGLNQKILNYIDEQGLDLISDVDLLINMSYADMELLGIPRIHLKPELAVDIHSPEQLDDDVN